jgi:Holliday junction resolvasome RuvABC endonuclease subunit
VILGIDTGLATCGWALLDEQTKSFVDLGVVISPPMDERVTLDRARRCNKQASVLAEKVRGVSCVVVERMSFPQDGKGRALVNACVPISLSWGVVLGLVAMLDPKPRLLTIAPQRWQREVLPNTGRSVDYELLAQRAAEHILKFHPLVAAKLLALKQAERSHAIDAAMIALCGALRPHRCEEIAA